VKVTPLDLKKAVFKKVMRGYDASDVDDLMAAAAETLEEMVRDNRELKEKVNNLNDRLKSYESMEHTLNETLITAQKAGDSTRQAAERESELIIAKAEVQAEKLVEEAKSELKRIRYQIEMLEHEKEAFLVKMRSLVASQWKILQEDFEPRKALAGRLYEEKAQETSDREAPRPGAKATVEVAAAPAPAPPEPEDAPEPEAEELMPEPEPEEDEQDFGNFSDKLGRILGNRGEEPREDDDRQDKRSLYMDESAGDDGDMVDLDGLPQEAGVEDEKPDVFWGDEEDKEK
jgi:cell division initiation protein